MAFLTVAGIDMQAISMEELDTEYIGEETRSYAGPMRTSIRGEYRGWRFTHLEMAPASYEALRAATALKAHVACSGTGLPAATTCSVTIDSAPFVHQGVGHLLVPSITLREV